MKRWSLAAISILYAVLAAAQQRPGQTGNIPDPPPPHSIDGTTIGPPPKPMACDLPEQVTVIAQTRVESCTTVDYAKLYDAAIADSARLDAWIVCPEGCSGVRFMVQQSWDCSPDVAEVHLTWVLLCSKTLHPPREMERPSADAFKEPMRYARIGNWQKLLAPARIVDMTDYPLDCPSNRFVGFTYEEETESCYTADYTDPIKRADLEAHRWYDSLKCPEGCEKSPWELVYKEWSCDDETTEKPTIKVEYLLSLACRK